MHSLLGCLSERLLHIKNQEVSEDNRKKSGLLSYIQTYFWFFPNLNIVFILIQDDASQENNMQAEVTGKLKQHFNNTLPKQNNTSAGVSVIMVRKMNIFIH